MTAFINNDLFRPGCYQRAWLLRGIVAAAAVPWQMITPAIAGGDGLVALSRVDPTIRQDMRYAGNENFTGAPVPGYEAGECWLRRSVARALSKVQADLERSEPGLSLKVFDCYRPRRSVRAFVAWAGASDDGRTRHYYPNLSRSALLSHGYIGRTSTHSKGIAVDLTLVRVSGAAKVNKTQDSKTAACTGTSDTAFDAASLDMGTTFDCFDPKSHTARSGLTAEQRQARQTLKRVMARHGFANYHKEWWHFTYGAADDGRSFDVPVRSAPGRPRQDRARAEEPAQSGPAPTRRAEPRDGSR